MIKLRKFHCILMLVVCDVMISTSAKHSILSSLVDNFKNITAGYHIFVRFRQLDLCGKKDTANIQNKFNEINIQNESVVNYVNYNYCRVCLDGCMLHSESRPCHSVILYGNGTGNKITQLQIHHDSTVSKFIQSEIRNVCEEYVNCSEINRRFQNCSKIHNHNPKRQNAWHLVEDISLFLSLLCLFFTIFVHVALPELRNLHGKNLTSFAGALFISQLFMFHDFGVKGHKTCIGIAVILQYFWLAVFSWTSVLSYDIARTFNAYNILKTRKTLHHGRRFGLYCLVGWGIPILVTSVSYFVTDKMYDDQSAYGRAPHCFLNFFVSIYTIGIPFVITSVFNCICFGIIIYGIESHRTKTAYLTSTRIKKRKSDRFKCILYGKLSVICGLAWVLLFMVHFFGDIFRKISLLLLNFQGILIFLSTVLFNNQAIGAVKNRMSRKETEPQNENGQLSMIIRR